MNSYLVLFPKSCLPYSVASELSRVKSVNNIESEKTSPQNKTIGWLQKYRQSSLAALLRFVLVVGYLPQYLSNHQSRVAQIILFYDFDYI